MKNELKDLREKAGANKSQNPGVPEQNMSIE
jgi:hypothetical protein